MKPQAVAPQMEVAVYAQQALDLRRNGHLQEAERLYQLALENDPYGGRTSHRSARKAVLAPQSP